MAGNFNKRHSSLERRMRKHTLFYWKKVGKHSSQMRKMTLHYFNRLKPGDFFFRTKYSSSKPEKFEVKKTLKNVMAPFYGWGSIASRLEPLGIGSLLSQFAKMFMFTTIFKGEMKIFAYLFQSGCFPPESWQGYLPSLGGIHERFHGQVLIAPKLETHVFQLRRWYELESYLVWLRTLLKLIGEYSHSGYLQ